MQKKEDTVLLTRQCLSYSFSVASRLGGYLPRFRYVSVEGVSVDEDYRVRSMISMHMRPLW